MSLKVNASTFSSNALITATVKAAMNNPNGKVTWEGSHWKIDAASILKPKKENKFNLFFSRRWHRINYRYSDNYRAKFKKACKVLNNAVKDSQKVHDTDRKIKKLKKRYKLLQKKEVRTKKKLTSLRKKIRSKQKTLKREEAELSSLVEAKVAHCSNLIKLENCSRLKQDLNKQLSSSTIARIRYSIGSPDAAVAKLSTSLNDIQTQLKIKPSYSDSELEELVNKERDKIAAIKKILSEKDSYQLENLPGEIEELRKVKAKYNLRFSKAKKQKKSAARALRKHGCHLPKLKASKKMKPEKSEKDVPATNKFEQTASVLAAIGAKDSVQLIELFTVLFAHLQENFDEDIVASYNEDKKNNTISITLKEPIRFWLSAQKHTKKIQGGAIFTLGDNPNKEMVLHYSNNELSVGGISAFVRLPKIPLVPKKYQDNVRCKTVNIVNLSFKDAQTVAVTVSWLKGLTKTIPYETLLSAWSTESKVITNAAINNLDYIKNMARIEKQAS